MSGKIKAVVAFAGARDGYQLPLALSEADLLDAFVTDMYWPADHQLFSATIGRILPDRMLRARFCRNLDSRKVIVSRRAWAASIYGRFAARPRMNQYINKILGQKARSIAVRHQAAMFCCSYYAFHAFAGAGEQSPYRFIFQLHPHPRTVRAILTEELKRTPFAAESLVAEPDLFLAEGDFEALASEPHLGNGWVVASRYSAQSLSEHGIPTERIHVVPYGVDHNEFKARLRPPNSRKPFTVAYVGSLIQRKGLSYLLDAVRLLGAKRIRVLLCGRGVVDEQLLSHYRDLYLEIYIGSPRPELVRRIQEADVFVLPSLAEGFAHVVLEAMACGLPVISTPHTCAPDVMADGVHGFIVPIRDAESIAEKIGWGIDHRDELAGMGEAAAAQSKLFTWERFRLGIRDAYQNMLASASN